MKYFQFLLENDINFTRDDNGHYIALVKVLNPNFYGDTANNTVQNTLNFKQSRFEEKKDSNNDVDYKPRSSSQVSKKTQKGKDISLNKFEKGEKKVNIILI